MDAIEYINIKISFLKQGIEEAKHTDTYYIYMCKEMIKVFQADKQDLISRRRK